MKCSDDLDSKTSLAELAETLGPMVYRRANAILRDPEEARDAMQDVFLQVLRAGPLPEVDASRWLYRVTTNACLNRLRSRRRQLAMRERNARGAATTSSPISDAEFLVRELLAEGEEECTCAALYVFVEGLTHEEAAHILGVSRRTVGNLLDRFVRWAQDRVESGELPAQPDAAVEVQRG
jgi:RNA polymerase sigma-70 factor, ECF subfamily